MPREVGIYGVDQNGPPPRPPFSQTEAVGVRLQGRGVPGAACRRPAVIERIVSAGRQFAHRARINLSARS